MRRRESMLLWGKTPAARRADVKSTPPAKSASFPRSAGAIEVVAVDENSAVGDVRVVVVNDPVVMPIIAPVVPDPTEPAEEGNSKAKAERDSRARKEKCRIRIPGRPDPDR